LAVLAKRVGRKMLFDISGIFSPDTVLVWYRKLVAAKYDGSKSRSKYFRRTIPDKVRQQIIDIARDHKHLGCRMLYGYLKYLGFKVSIKLEVLQVRVKKTDSAATLLFSHNHEYL
jgi:putative transposase